LKSKHNSSFLKHVATLLRGNIFAQVIPILITPVITRLYSIEAIGVLAIFVSITSILGVVFPAGLEQAVILPKSQRRANRVVTLAFTSVAVMTLLVALGLFAFKTLWPENSVFRDLGMFIWIIPPVTACIASVNVLNQLHLRKSRIKEIANGTIAKFISLGSVQIVLGWIGAVGGGLVWGRVTSNIVQLIYLAKRIDFRHFRSSQSELMLTLRRYKKFPLFNIWGSLANISAIYMVAVLIALFYGTGEAGEFALMQRVLVIPVFLIGQAFGQIYYKQIVSEKIQMGNGRQAYLKSLAALTLFSILIFGSIYLFGTRAIDVFLGEKVSNVSTYVEILVPMFFIRFIASPLSMTLNAFERQEVNMLWQLSLLFSIIGVFIVAQQLQHDLPQLLKSYSVVVSIMYVIQLILTYKVASRGSVGLKAGQA